MDGVLRVLPEGRELGRRREHHHVGVACLEGDHPRPLLGDHLEDHAVQERLVAPVVGVPLDDDVGVRLPLDELERPGADRRPQEAVTQLLDGSRRDNRHVEHRHRPEDRTVRLLGDDVDGQIVHDLGPGDRAGEARPPGRRRALERAVERELDRRRVERRPVVELDVGPELEAHLGRGHHLVARGQPRLDRHLLVEVDERLEDVVVHPGPGSGGLGVRVERNRVGRPDDRERPAPLLGVGRRREGDQPHRQDARQDGADWGRQPAPSTHRSVSLHLGRRASRPGRSGRGGLGFGYGAKASITPAASSRACTTRLRSRTSAATANRNPSDDGSSRDSSRARWSPARGGTGMARS